MRNYRDNLYCWISTLLENSLFLVDLRFRENWNWWISLCIRMMTQIISELSYSLELFSEILTTSDNFKNRHLLAWLIFIRIKSIIAYNLPQSTTTDGWLDYFSSIVKYCSSSDDLFWSTPTCERFIEQCFNERYG